MKLGEHTSSCMDIACGTPQGSVLGPKCFILYDISNVSKVLKLVLFTAADTNVFCSRENKRRAATERNHGGN